MPTLRELLDKQKAEKDAVAMRPIETGVSLSETFAAPASEPPKLKGVLGRLGIKPNGNATSISVPIPQTQHVMTRTEVPITMQLPPQDLPQSSVEELRKNLDFLAENIDQKNLVGQVVRVIAVQLQENPQFSSSVKDTDYDLLVRGLRRSYTIAARRRVELAETKAEKREDVVELETMMKDLGVNFKF